MRGRAASGNTSLDRLGADDRIPLSRGELDALLADRLSFTGAAADQVAAVGRPGGEITSRHPDAARYAPGAIL